MATKSKQKRIEGTYDPTPDDVQEAVDKYLGAKRKIANLRGTMNEWKGTLIERMNKHKLEEIEIDDGDKILHLEERNIIRIEAVKKDKGSEDGEDEEDE